MSSFRGSHDHRRMEDQPTITRRVRNYLHGPEAELSQRHSATIIYVKNDANVFSVGTHATVLSSVCQDVAMIPVMGEMVNSSFTLFG